MKKFFKLFALLVSVVCCFAFTSVTVLAEDEYPYDKEQSFTTEWDNTNGSIVQPIMSCPYCSGSWAPLVCMRELLKYGTSTHKPLGSSKTCTITYFQSTSKAICENCLRVVEYYGYHDCLWYHDTCSTGALWVCNCERWDGAS